MKLAKYLEDKNTTDAAFAEKVGVSQSQITRLKNGKSKPSWEVAVKIEAVTNGRVKAKDFVTDDAQEASAA